MKTYSMDFFASAFKMSYKIWHSKCIQSYVTISVYVQIKKNVCLNITIHTYANLTAGFNGIQDSFSYLQ